MSPKPSDRFHLATRKGVFTVERRGRGDWRIAHASFLGVNSSMVLADARDGSSVLSALGLTALVLAPWLLFRQELLAAFVVAANLLAVGSLTKRLSPVLALRIAASKGDRVSLRLLEAHDSAWAKIKDANLKA